MAEKKSKTQEKKSRNNYAKNHCKILKKYAYRYNHIARAPIFFDVPSLIIHITNL